MKTFTAAILKKFKKIGRQDETPDPIVICKLFGGASATWFLTEYDAETKIAFGFVTGLQFDEWGSVDIPELEAMRFPPFNLPIERDMYFSPHPFSKCYNTGKRLA